METIWTKETVDELVERWKRGESANTIARALQTSKNAVIGKAHRIGLDPRSTLKVVSKGGRYCKIPMRPENAAAYDSSNKPLPCLWPIGKEAPFGQCGKPRLAGKPYCADHAARAYKQPDPNQQRAIR